MSDDNTKNGGEEERQGEDFGTSSGTKESSPGGKKATPEVKKEETGKTETGAEDKGAKL